MKLGSRRLVASLFLVSIFYSAVYYEFTIDESTNSNLDENRIPTIEDLEDFSEENPISEDPDRDIISKSLIEGDYKLQGFFTHNEFVNLDADGSIYVLEEYEDMRTGHTSNIDRRFDMNKYSGSEYNWPNQSNIYNPLKYVNYPNTLSSMFSPVFNEDTWIEGKVYILTHFETIHFSSITATLGIKLLIFDPLSGNTTEILSSEHVLANGLSISTGDVFSPALNSTYLIPEGNRLKLSFQVKISDILGEGEIYLHTSHKHAPTTYNWDIIDGEYSNNFNFPHYDRILGMQIQYKSADYPEIKVTGITNSSYYYEAVNANITVSDSESNSYRWDTDSFTPFMTSVNTSIPTVEGWHTLEIVASDEFNNTAIEKCIVGYDPTVGYISLENALNNSVINSYSFLNFTVSGVNNATFEWDNNGTLFDLFSFPDFDIPIVNTGGQHNLSILLVDTCVTEEYLYFFTVDDANPVISLVNVLNDTLQPINKLLEINITDLSTPLTVQYKWDDNIFLPLIPSDGTIYHLYTPLSAGLHNLTITAEDSFGQYSEKFFVFNISSSALLVELHSMTNNSWYYGGNVVEVTISGINGTLEFKWDNNAFQDGNPFLSSQILSLEGANSLPSNPTTVHILTIIVGSIENVEFSFTFIFNIDQEAPLIDPSILDLNDERFTNEEIFDFIITDNATSVDNLDVWISIDGDTNQSLNNPFDYSLSSLSDGLHNISLIVYDIAGNNASQFILFYVDSSTPVVTFIDFEGLVTLPDESKYVPGDSLIQVTFSDADSIIGSTFSWDSLPYQTFTNSFVLSYSDSYGQLIINASDSLGNEIILSYFLTIDSLAPNVSLSFPYEFSDINSATSLVFHISDFSSSTLSQVNYFWDIAPGFNLIAIPDSNGDFNISLLPGYSHNDAAFLSIFAEDIVGNNMTYFLSFNVDLVSPDPTLLVFDTLLNEYVDASTCDFLVCGDVLWYDNTTCSDLAVFFYYWNNGTEQVLTDPWQIEIPSLYGYHNLTVTLQDKTGEGTSPNEISVVYSFIIKMEGGLTILESSQTSATFGETLFIDLTLKDDQLNALVITTVRVNESSMPVVLLDDYEYQITYSTSLAGRKGNFSLSIFVESEFVFGSTNDSYTFEIEVLPIQMSLNIESSDLEIVEGNQVIISGTLTYPDDTPAADINITFFIYVYYKIGGASGSKLAIEGFDDVFSLSGITDSNGNVNVNFLLTSDIEYIRVSALVSSTETTDEIKLEFDQSIYTVKGGLPPTFFYLLIGGSIALAAIIAFIVYKIVKKKPFEKYLEKVKFVDVTEKMDHICPGIVLSIFDQSKGPVPLLSQHSFEQIKGKISLEIDNFLLKICDQAYSTLGFEEVHQGRKTSTFNLPNEELIGYVHAIQLDNPTARGGYENLSVILMIPANYDNLFLSHVDYIFEEVDILRIMLQNKTKLKEIKEQINSIRKRTTQVILASIKES